MIGKLLADTQVQASARYAALGRDAAKSTANRMASRIPEVAVCGFKATGHLGLTALLSVTRDMSGLCTR